MYVPLALFLVLNYDFLISFYPPDSLIFQFFTKIFAKRNISIVHQARNITVTKYSHYLWKKHYDSAYMVVAMSEDVKKEVSKIYDIDRKKIKVIYNGIELDQIKRFKKIEKLNGDPAILYVGRLEYIKGPDILIDAFNLVLKNLPNAHLHIVGDGTMREELEKKTVILNIDKNVKFYGYVIPPYSHMKSADILVIPSRYDAMPNVTLEAMACNIPIIASDVGGLKNIIIEGKNGLKAEPTLDGMASAIIRLWTNKLLIKNIKEFQKEFIKKFTWEKSVQEYIKVIGSIG